MNTAVAPLAGARTETRYFYVWLALIFLLVSFGGFIPTYWAPVMGGRFKGEGIFHIHGLLLFSWTLFYFMQTLFVARHQVMDHRSWGLAGIALFSVLMCSILVAQGTVLKRFAGTDYLDAARRFSAVTLIAWPIMAALFAAAIYYIKRPETHKRLMTSLLIVMMTPAIARVFIVVMSSGGGAGIASGPPPPFVVIPTSLVADLLFVPAFIHDWRTQGRPHAAYLWGVAVAVLYPLVAVAVARTDAWLSFVRGFEGLTN